MSASRCLTIAGSDSGGGAGIQADLKTFQVFGCFGMSAITALTAQNTKGVAEVFAATPDFVAKQIEVVVTDIGVDAAKTGMLFSAEIIRAVVREVRRLSIRPLVVDPVMVASSGDRLLRQDAVTALRDELLPLATVVTPNVAEAEVLAGFAIDDARSLERAARAIASFGAEWVVLKGGDRVVPGLSTEDESVDWVYGQGEAFSLRGRRLPGVWHGTGCTFSAAIIRAVVREVRRLSIRPLVVDPVMVASSGDRLLRQDAVTALRDELLPLATVVTPNVAEAEVLAGFAIDDARSLERAARAIASFGAEWVVLKGGDRVVPGLSTEDESVDWVYGQGEAFSLRGRRLPGVWHGTGCTFSAAICALLARGNDVATSLREAKLFVQGALEHAERIGTGAQPVNQWWTRDEFAPPVRSR
ncbi:MAG: bifunctional hydroxymethylpyrimidine kinase/phosphomethylpyrimidine kinase [Chloroflexi bacterium]|nr:MAG: bifunctional hydroxymethylpyrimidine kinase/phosphomethylpyrimidine kinase [Chloroflexota bacterium]